MNQKTPVGFLHSSFSGKIGIARADITPPVGIYSRNWGSAKHDYAESIHRPLTLNAMTISSTGEEPSLIFVEGDLCWWRSQSMFEKIRSQLMDEFNIDSTQLIFGLTHTHAAVTLTDIDTNIKNPEVTAKYLEDLYQKTVLIIKEALQNSQEALLEWHTGRCQLATNRDFPDPASEGNRVICGYSPDNSADDTLVVGRVTNNAGEVLATLVNYACHPTTLAGENKSISPDYIGAMREVIENNTSGAISFYMHGASGELAPRYQYVGDTRVADRHGRQLGHAVMATLEDMQPAGTGLVFDHVADSGAPLAVWKNKTISQSGILNAKVSVARIPLKNWPTAEELESQRSQSQDRAEEERLKRKRAVRLSVGDGTHYDLKIYGWRIGDMIVIGANTEAYSDLQTKLRKKYKNLTIVCMNLINGTIGYLPPEDLYDIEIYQVIQTPFDRGSLEIVIDTMDGLIQDLLGSQ